MELSKRLSRLKSLKEKVDKIILFNFPFKDPNYFYFTNSNTTGIFYYDFKKPFCYLTGLEKSTSWIKTDILSKKSDFETFFSSLKGTIGINKKYIPASFLKKFKCKLVDISDFLDNIRMIKTKYEIKYIKQACKISKNVFESLSFSGTEKSLKAELEYKINLVAENSFSPIIASGKNIKYPHHIATNEKIKKPILVDFGARYKGYCSDITRTIGSKYDLSKLIEEIESMLFPGAKCKDIDNIARKKLGKQFITTLGHGIGVDVHERPLISSNSKDILQPGMVISIEPAIYVKNGIRVENNYLITKSGYIKLTDF